MDNKQNKMLNVVANNLVMFTVVKYETNLRNSMYLSVGLSVSESAKLCSYMHFRDAICLQEKSLLQKANLDKAIDFMDTLEEDIPKGQSERMNRKSHKLKIRHLANFLILKFFLHITIIICILYNPIRFNSKRLPGS